jgi:thymidylate kinase
MIGCKDPIVDKFMHNHMGVAHMYLAELFFVQEQVKEALLTNNVICSRWHYSTMAYIGDSQEVINFIGNASKDLLKPNLVIRLKIDVEEALNRVDTRNTDKPAMIRFFFINISFYYPS